MKKRYIRKGKCNHCGWCCLQEETRCEHLLGDKPGEYRCSIWGTEERTRDHMGCVIHPQLPPIHNDSCGYYFIDTWENNKEVKRIV